MLHVLAITQVTHLETRPLSPPMGLCLLVLPTKTFQGSVEVVCPVALLLINVTTTTTAPRPRETHWADMATRVVPFHCSPRFLPNTPCQCASTPSASPHTSDARSVRTASAATGYFTLELLQSGKCNPQESRPRPGAHRRPCRQGPQGSA